MNTEQILYWSIALAALTAAVVVAIKAPKSTWHKNTPDHADNPHDWAPEYALSEKLKILAIQLVIALPFFFLIKFLYKIETNLDFFCGQTWGMNHFSWVIAGTLVLVMLVFISGMIYQSYAWIKVYRQAQFPAPGQKVWKSQKIIRGEAAKRRAKLSLGLMMGLGVIFTICLFVLLFVIQGLVTPEALTAKCSAIS